MYRQVYHNQYDMFVESNWHSCQGSHYPKGLLPMNTGPKAHLKSV